eukprot:3633844-Pleurochrysis_carterae.AAC.2
MHARRAFTLARRQRAQSMHGGHAARGRLCDLHRHERLRGWLHLHGRHCVLRQVDAVATHVARFGLVERRGNGAALHRR